MTFQLWVNFTYFTQNTNHSTMPPNQKLILKSHKTIISGCVQKLAPISLILKPKYPHLPQVQLPPLYMGRGTNLVQHAGKCSWKSLSLAMLACPDAHRLQPKTYHQMYKDNMILSFHCVLAIGLWHFQATSSADFLHFCFVWHLRKLCDSVSISPKRITAMAVKGMCK